MKTSMRDLKTSGGQVVGIIGTNALREHEWLGAPVYVMDEAKQTLTPIDRTYILFVRKEDVEQATGLWPDAGVTTPANDWLVTTQ